jgi:hypothetical protein
MIWNRSDTSRRLVRRRPGEGGSAWTKADIRHARQTPLKPVLEKLGYRLEPRPHDNYAISGITPEIVVRDHYWVCTETGAAGNAIDFFVRLKNTSFNDAMKLLTPPPAS